MKKLLFLSICSIFCLVTFAQTKTWIGTAGASFGVAATWSPAGVPTSINNAVIPTGSTVNISIGNVYSIDIQGNSTITLSGNLTFVSTATVDTNATVTWTSGALNGGVFTNNGTINLTSVLSKGINDSTDFINNGTLNINSDGYLMLSNNNHSLHNTTSGVINLNAGGQITHMLGSGSGVLINSGLLKKQQSNVGFLILAAFKNDYGTVTVENGTLTISAVNGDIPNVILHGGIYNVDSGQTLEWEGPYTLKDTLSGQLDGLLNWKGTVNVDTATEAVFDFDGPSGLTWSSGIFQGNGTLTNMGIINLEKTSAKTIYGHSVLRNNGTFNINSDGFLILTNPSPTFENTLTGVLNINAGGQITHSAGSGRGLLLNKGLIKKQQSNGGFAILSNLHNDDGTITVADGTLTLYTPNAVLSDGIYNVTAGNKMEWQGVVTLEGTITGQVDGEIDWINTVNVPSGAEATINFTNPAGLTWLSGSLSGDGTLKNTGILSLEGSNGWGIDGQSILKNEEVINYNGTGLMILRGTSTLNNTASGIINLNNSGQITYSVGVGTLLNSGLVKKQISGGDFIMFANMNNLTSGIFQSDTGILELRNYAGTGTLSGNGSVKLPNGTDFEGNISPGGVPGKLTHVGNYKATTNAIIAVDLKGSTAISEYDVFDIQGAAVLDGDILINLTFEPNISDEFVILTASSITSCNLPATVSANYNTNHYTFEVNCNPTDVTLKVSNIAVGIKENSLCDFALYPNPTNDRFTIDLGREYKDVSVQIINLTGQIISSNKYSSVKLIEQRITDAAGVYFIKINIENKQTKSFKVMKK